MIECQNAYNNQEWKLFMVHWCIAMYGNCRSL